MGSDESDSPQRGPEKRSHLVHAPATSPSVARCEVAPLRVGDAVHLSGSRGSIIGIERTYTVRLSTGKGVIVRSRHLRLAEGEQERDPREGSDVVVLRDSGSQRGTVQGVRYEYVVELEGGRRVALHDERMAQRENMP
jgi:hypothetical protein